MIRYNLKYSVQIRGLHCTSFFAKNQPEPLPQRGNTTIYNKIRSASNVDGYRKAQNKMPPGMYFQAAQSSPQGSIHSETIPSSFMPKDDPRRVHVTPHLQQQPMSNAPAVLTGCSSEKSYHLTPKKIEELVQLRKSDPKKYTRRVLAKQFNVSPLFVSLVSSASDSQLKEMAGRLQLIKSRWPRKTAEAREERRKRHQNWYREL